MQLTAPTFCAGLVLAAGNVVNAAPIVAFMIGWNVERVRVYADRRGWKLFEYD